MGKIIWTGYELDLLRKKYPKKGCDIPELREKFSKSAITTKAYRLSIHCNNVTLTKHHKWTKEDIDILKKEYPSKGVNIPILIERHGKGGIDSKAQKLDINCDFPHKEWTKDEIELLKKHYPNCGTNIPELLKTRTYRSIMQKARLMDIPFTGDHKNYDISKEILYDLYIVQQKSTIDIAKKYGCSVDTIRSRMIEYNIPFRERRESTIIAKGGLAHFKMNDYIKQILDGVVISDGYIGTVGKIDTPTGSLIINQKEENKEWIETLCNIFNQNGIKCKITKRKSKLNDKVFKQVCLTSLSYVELGEEWKRWYKNNKKSIPKDLQFTPVFLAHWYMGDGYLSKDHRKNRTFYKVGLCTDCFTKQESEYLADRINKKYGYSFRVAKHRSTHRLELSKILEIMNFLLRISPYIVDCFKYKLEPLYNPQPVIIKKRWTKKEEEILKKEFPKKGSNIPQLIRKGKSKNAIGQRAQLLGIKCETRYWTEEEDMIIKKKFPEFGNNIAELLSNGRTKYAIQHRAIALGVKCDYIFNQFGKNKKE